MARSVLATGLAALVAVVGSSSVSGQEDPPHIFACEDHDAVFMLGWVQAQDRFLQLAFHNRDGTLAGSTNVLASGTQGARVSVGDHVTPFDGSCVVPSGVVASVLRDNGNGTRTPFYGPLSSNHGSDLVFGVPQDVANGVTSEILLANPNGFPVDLTLYCNDAANGTVGERSFTVAPLARESFVSTGPDNQTCDLVNNTANARVFAGVLTDLEESGDYVYTPGVLTADFDGRDVLVPLLGGPQALVFQNLWFAQTAHVVIRNGNGKVVGRGDIEIGERQLAVIEDVGMELGLTALERAAANWALVSAQGALGVHSPRYISTSLGQTRAADSDQFATSVPGYTSANATSDSAVVLGFDYPEGATLTYRVINAGKKKAKIQVTIGRLDGTIVSSKKYKLKRNAATEVSIPAAEQGNDLYVRTEVLKKGPVVTYLEQLLSGGKVNYFPGQNES